MEVFDVDGSNLELIGRTQITVGEVMGARNQTVIKDVMPKSGNKPCGKIVVRGEEVAGNRQQDILHLTIHCHKIEDVEVFSKSDPFLVFSRIKEDQSWLRVYQTESKDDDLNPKFRPFEISTQTLSNNDFYRPIKIECWDHSDKGNHKVIGHCQTNVNEILTQPTLTLQSVKKQGKSAGQVQFVVSALEHRPSFLEFIEGGCSLSFMVAIDFTGSNGAPSDPRSLHFQNPQAPNEYERAIMAIGGILEQYDYDKWFPVWGFGASVGHGQPVSHCFPLNGNPENPCAQGISSILSTYRNVVPHLQFSGPTLFEAILNQATAISAQPWQPGTQQYNILLILTDGAIHDMNAVKERIVDASGLPLSIIIVGVGQADFSLMEALDCDKGMLRDGRGRQAARDIVQFVPFRKLQGNAAALAAQVLAEAPGQLTGFMKVNGQQPMPKQVVPNSAITVPPPNEGEQQAAVNVVLQSPAPPAY